jgi:uncharacterized membrane protein YbhN (UPF0104 family)
MATVLPIGLVRLKPGLEISRAALTHPLETWTLLFPLGMKPWIEERLNEARRFAQRVLDSLSFWLKTPHFLGMALIFTWLHMLCLFSALWFFTRGMNEELSFLHIGGLWSMVYFVTLLPLSINGLGIQEVAITFFFSNIGGLRLETALSLAILIRALLMIASLPGVAFIPMILSSNKERAVSIKTTESSALKPTTGLEK